MKPKKTLTIALMLILLSTLPFTALASDGDSLSGEGYVVVPANPVQAVEEPKADPVESVQPVEAADQSDSAAADDEVQERLVGTVKLTSGNLNIRKGPTLEDEVIGKLPNGSRVEVLEQLDEWVKIPYQGTSAYVSKPYLVIAKETIKPNAGASKIIVLDPGHGGKDPGAIASDKTYESTLVWGYAVKAKEVLEKSGYTVIMTRDEKNSCTDYKSIYDELDCRSGLANKVGGHLYISLHADANPSKNFRGTVTFYNARNDLDGYQNPFPQESKRLAELIQSQVQPTVGSKDRGVDNKNYYVNRMNTVPSVLIELGVMTNAEDLKLLKSKSMPEKVAVALRKALDQYFSEL